MGPFKFQVLQALNWRAAVHSAARLVMRVFYVVIVTGLAAASVLFLDDAGVGIVRDSITSSSLNFSVAMLYVILGLLFVCWRFKINPVGAFNVLERARDNPTGLGLFLGLTVFGLCYLAGSIFGT